VPPTLTAPVLAVLTRLRSADSTDTETVPVLLVGTVSVVPGGTLTVAVLIRLPEALAATCAWKVTVTLPPEGIVTEPVRPVSVATKLAVLALALTALTTLVTVPRPVGRVSAKLAPVAVLARRC
jgi:hypothetical protein